MNKENVLFGIIGLLAGLIIGFTVTNYINRNSEQFAAISTVKDQSGALPNKPVGSEVDARIVKEQQQTGGKTGGAALPQVQETLDRATKNPNDFAAQTAAAEMYYRIKGFDKAAQFYEKASGLKPDDYDIIVKVGNVYYDKAATATEAGSDGTTDFKLAEKWYLKALSKKPDDINVRTDLGLTFFLRQPKDVDRAVQEYNKSLAVNPRHELTLQNLAAALREKGDTNGLQTTLAQLQKVNPNNPAVSENNQ
ncbi:MAG: tetratricopeptide repeat protein [Pyrinomonadaceae bacterium]